MCEELRRALLEGQRETRADKDTKVPRRRSIKNQNAALGHGEHPQHYRAGVLPDDQPTELLERAWNRPHLPLALQ